MKIKLDITVLLFGIYCSGSVGYAHFAAFVHDVHRFMDRSDLVVTGAVVKRMVVFNDRGESAGFLGNYYPVRVDQVIFADPEIAEAIFSSDNLKRINANLKRRKPMHIFVFHQHPMGSGIGWPKYFPDMEFLYFFKVSKFPDKFPNSYVYDSSSASESQRRIPVANLDQPFFFQAASDSRDCTRNLKNKREAEWLPIAEALGEAMSIPNLTRKERSLRQLTQHKNPDIAGNAQSALDTFLKRTANERLRRQFSTGSKK